eukprot:365545-Chlamydomonas_euryale.AAC.2
MHAMQMHAVQMHAVQMHAMQMHALQMHAMQVHALQMHAMQMHAMQMHAVQMHAVQMHAVQMHALQMHAVQMHALQMHALQMHAMQMHAVQMHAMQMHAVQMHAVQTHAAQVHGVRAHGAQWHARSPRLRPPPGVPPCRRHATHGSPAAHRLVRRRPHAMRTPPAAAPAVAAAVAAAAAAGRAKGSGGERVVCAAVARSTAEWCALVPHSGPTWVFVFVRRPSRQKFEAPGVQLGLHLGPVRMLRDVEVAPCGLCTLVPLPAPKARGLTPLSDPQKHPTKSPKEWHRCTSPRNGNAAVAVPGQRDSCNSTRHARGGSSPRATMQACGHATVGAAVRQCCGATGPSVQHRCGCWAAPKKVGVTAASVAPAAAAVRSGPQSCAAVRSWLPLPHAAA